MKKKTLTVVLMSALLASAVGGVLVVRLGKANPTFMEGGDSPPLLYLISPLNKTYNGKVLLNFTVCSSEHWSYGEVVNSISYSVDWIPFDTISVNNNLFEPVNYSIFLENLTDGNHVLRVFVDYTGWIFNKISGETSYPIASISAMANFTLDTTSPTIQVLSLKNKTYYESALQLNFTVSEDFYNASYVLDGQRVHVTENFTLSDLPVGSHNLTVYAEDAAGNMGTSEAIYFTIEEPFPTSLVITSVVPATVVLVGLGLLLYRIKRK